MSQFNLVDEKWIPVRFLDGTRDELGISDVLLKSKEIESIEDSSPLVVVALYRFLLAVLYRALEGPTDIDQAKDFFKDGLPSEKITAYLVEWRDRFWLFDEKHPFGQIPSFEPETWRAWTSLAAEHNADNAKVLFDHVDVRTPGGISEGVAVRWMLATQTFSVSCGNSELSHTGTAPSATAVMVLPLGRDLQDTLLFSLVPQNREIFINDVALWERAPELVENLKMGVERQATGFADIYMWRTRAVRFQRNDTSCIKSLAFASGVGCSSTDLIDPMLGYRIDDVKGRLPVQFRDRGLWRDFDSLLPDQSSLSPRVIEHAITLTRANGKRFPKSMMALGQANNKAKIEYWRMDYFSLPGALAADRYIRVEIRQLLIDAEKSQKILWAACRSFARDLLSRGARKPDGKDISKFVEQISVNSWYWSMLESRFHEILREYTLNRDDEEIRYLWLNAVRDSLKSAWDQHSASVSTGDAWAIRALVKAEGRVLRQLKKLRNEISILEPVEVSA
ncbi:MAG: type I-E CRISPR-associated protein Cse1/CasA [Verrucomicrobia bacterium]|nr:type I-E CRISPR-associated protein Cse1/CasA [Verrucomicrobiota bacterium]